MRIFINIFFFLNSNPFATLNMGPIIAVAQGRPEIRQVIASEGHFDICCCIVYMM